MYGLHRVWIGFAIVFGDPAWAQVTQRVSLSSSGLQGDGVCALRSSTPNGRYLAIDSNATNLVPGDVNAYEDIFVRDRRSGTIELVSVDSNGHLADSSSYGGWLSADGRFVAFSSFASNLVPGDSNGTYDGFVHDRVLGTTERISVSSTGIEGNGYSDAGPMTADGRFVAFASEATNLVPGPHGIGWGVYLRDRQNGTTERVGVPVGGGVPNGSCMSLPSISADGRFVAFSSAATNLVLGDTNSRVDTFVFDRQRGTNELVSVSSGGVQANDDCPGPTSISADGRFVAFYGYAWNLVPGDANGWPDVFVRDRQLGTTERVSVSSSGAEGDDVCPQFALSSDGRYVAFLSYASNLVAGDTNGRGDVFVRDRWDGTTERVSVDSQGTQGNDHACNSEVAISPDGRYVGFSSFASNLIPNDTNQKLDVFIRDRLGGPAFVGLCDPGVGGVITCPCANAPSGAGHGCDNASSTGGAVLTASGGTYLSSDSLVLTAIGERPNALSFVTQWTGSNPAGSVLGMGVGCTSGAARLLYARRASGGSITAPDFGAGDPQVSVRSAALGDPLHPGDSRWYVVLYRDSSVLGSCPATATFNCTPTGRATWLP